MPETILTHRVEELEESMKSILLRESDYDNKFITYKQFYWTVGVLMSVVVGMFYLIYSRQELMASQLLDISKNSSETQKNVSFIQGVLQNAQITK